MNKISDLVGNARSLRKDGVWFRDSVDRYVIFRGINLGSRTKLPPYLPVLPLHVTRLDDQAIMEFRQELNRLLPKFDHLQEMGFNVVRLLVMWKAIEPVPNQKPEVLLPEGAVYLYCIKEVIDVLYERGIFVIIDFHQDVAHEVFDGDGFPNWISDSIVLSEIVMSSEFYKFLQSFGHMQHKNKLWSIQYLFNRAVISTLRDFWKNSNKNKPRTHLEKTIGATARFFQAMHGNHGHPAILGYELFNEPHPVEIDVNQFEKEILPEYYQNTISEIRRSFTNNIGDTQSFIFVEPRIDATIRSISSNWLEILPDIWLKKLVSLLIPPESKLDLSSISDQRIVFSFHYYDPLLFVSIPKDMKLRVQEWARIFKDLCWKAKDLKAIPFLSEFGADQQWKQQPSILSSDFNDLTSEVIEKQYELVEENLLNATYWNYDFYNTHDNHDNWNLEDFSILGSDHKLRNQDVVARPYPMRSSAKPTLLKFSPKTRHCIMMFSDVPVDAKSMIYVPNHIHYTDGFEVHATSNDIQFDRENKILLWQPSKNSTEHQIIFCLPGGFDESNLPSESLNLFRKVKHYKVDF